MKKLIYVGLILLCGLIEAAEKKQVWYHILYLNSKGVTVSWKEAREKIVSLGKESGMEIYDENKECLEDNIFPEKVTLISDSEDSDQYLGLSYVAEIFSINDHNKYVKAITTDEYDKFIDYLRENKLLGIVDEPEKKASEQHANFNDLGLE